jgi:hypothetical protein
MRALPGRSWHTAVIAMLSILSACSHGPGPAASAPPAAGATPSASSAPASVSIAPSASPVAAGTYWPKSACTYLIEPSGQAVWNWCVESVTLRPSGELVFRCRWEFPEFSKSKIEKGTDEGNRNMYVVDGAGRRMDHVTTTEGARLGGTLAPDTPTLRGDFVFPSGAVEPPFTFHDADNNVAIEGIRLEAAQRSDGEGRGNPALRARLGQLRKADEIVIDKSWGGLGKSSANHYVLRRAGGGATAGASVPAATMDAFLARLAGAPLVEGPYIPRQMHTDDFPRLAITFGTGDDRLVVFSESQGADRYPWALQFEGRRYVLSSDAPARALDLVKAHLAAAEVKVAPGRPEESPPPGSRRALASELVAASTRGDVAGVRRLLAAGADPTRGDDETGASAVHAAAALGHAEILALFADSGAALDAPDFQGLTPLLRAAGAGHAQVVKMLLQRGARSQVADALREAAAGGHLEIVRALIQAGAPVDARDELGLTALMYAIGRGVTRPDVMKALLDSGAAVNAVDMEGRTALHHLASSATSPSARGAGSAAPAVRILMAAGADPRVKDTEGQSVLDVLAARPGAVSSEILAAIKDSSPR